MSHTKACDPREFLERIAADPQYRRAVARELNARTSTAPVTAVVRSAPEMETTAGGRIPAVVNAVGRPLDKSYPVESPSCRDQEQTP